MTLREEFEQNQEVAKKFSDRMNKLSDSLGEFNRHIKEIIKKDTRSKAEILSAIEKVSFEMDCAIEAAEDYCDLLKDRILYIGRYDLQKDLPILLQTLPNTIRDAATCLGNISNPRNYRPKKLKERAGMMDIALKDILSAPNEQIKLIESITNDIRSMLYDMQERIDCTDDDALSDYFNNQYNRYIQEEVERYNRYEKQIIITQESLSELYSNARENEVLKLWRSLMDEATFMREALKKQLTESQLLDVFDYIAKECIIREKINPSPQEEIPTLYYDFIKGVGLKEKKRKVGEINKEISETCKKFCPKRGKNCKTCKSKQKVLQEVFKLWLSHIDELPKYKVFNNLFGRAITISENSYNTFSNDFAKKYHIKKKSFGIKY